jgi:hypothetical protein
MGTGDPDGVLNGWGGYARRAATILSVEPLPPLSRNTVRLIPGSSNDESASAVACGSSDCQRMAPRSQQEHASGSTGNMVYAGERGMQPTKGGTTWGGRCWRRG